MNISKPCYINATKTKILDDLPFGLVRVQYEDDGEPFIIDKCALTDTPDYTPTISLGLLTGKKEVK